MGDGTQGSERIFRIVRIIAIEIQFVRDLDDCPVRLVKVFLRDTFDAVLVNVQVVTDLGWNGEPNDKTHAVAEFGVGFREVDGYEHRVFNGTRISSGGHEICSFITLRLTTEGFKVASVAQTREMSVFVGFRANGYERLSAVVYTTAID